jgi:hypothetical protein
LHAAQTRTGGLLLLAIVVWAAPRSARADDAIRLKYSAPPACPSAREFEQAVRERMRRARLAREGEMAREYRVVVRNVAGRSVAELEFVASNGAKILRQVDADRCDQAVRAIALVTALAIDAVVPGADPEAAPAPVPTKPSGDSSAAEEPTGEPGAPEQRPPAKPSPDGTAPDEAASADARKRAPEKTPKAKPAPKRKPAAMDTRSERRPSAELSQPTSPPRFELGARGTVTSPKAPNVLFGAELFAGLGDRDSTWLVQLGLAAETGPRVEKGPGAARFTFFGARLQGCAFGQPIAPRLVAWPCAVVEGGAVVVEGIIDEPETVTDPWFAAGPSGRLSFSLERLALLLEGGVVFPLTTEDRAVFGPVERPQTTVHSVPWIGGIASLGVAWGIE